MAGTLVSPELERVVGPAGAVPGAASVPADAGVWVTTGPVVPWVDGVRSGFICVVEDGAFAVGVGLV